MQTGLSTDRVETLADGIFAIAMTLLVLNLGVPNLLHGDIARELPHKLLALWPNLLSYALSFIVLGMYWVGHHNQFHFIQRADRTLLWINVFFLMAVAFIPFSAALLARYPDQQVAVVIYGASLIVVGLLLYLLWWYATLNHRLVDSDISPEAVRRGGRRVLIAPVVYLLAIASSFLSPRISIVFYILVPFLYILPSRIDRQWLHTRKSAEAAVTEPRQ